MQTDRVQVALVDVVTFRFGPIAGYRWPILRCNFDDRYSICFPLVTPVDLTIFVTGVEFNTEVWRAREEFFNEDFPTCSRVEVSKLAAPNIFVEIEGIAYTGD